MFSLLMLIRMYEQRKDQHSGKKRSSYDQHPLQLLCLDLHIPIRLNPIHRKSVYDGLKNTTIYTRLLLLKSTVKSLHGHRLHVIIPEVHINILWKIHSMFAITCVVALSEKALFAAMIEQASDIGHHSIIATISADQIDSIVLHESFDFRKVSQSCEVARKFSRCLNVTLLQRML